MKNLFKLTLVAFGFGIAFIASSNAVKASNTAAAPAKECHGTGTCFTTDAGTVIYGKWTDATK